MNRSGTLDCRTRLTIFSFFGLWILGIFLIFASLLPSTLATASSDPDYESFLTPLGFTFAETSYERTETPSPIFQNSDFLDETIDYEDVDHPLNSGNNYSFVLPETASGALEWTITFPSPVSFFYLDIIRPNGTQERHYSEPSFVLENAEPGLYSFSLTTETPLAYGLEGHLLEWTVLNDSRTDAVLIDPDQIFSETTLFALNSSWESGHTIFLIGNVEFSEHFGLYFDDETLSRGLTAQEIDQGLGFLKSMDSFSFIDSVAPPEGCRSTTLLPFGDEILIQSLQCFLPEQAPLQMYALSESLFYHENPTDLLSAYLKPPQEVLLPFSLTTSLPSSDFFYGFSWALVFLTWSMLSFLFFPQWGEWLLDPMNRSPKTVGEFLIWCRKPTLLKGIAFGSMVLGGGLFLFLFTHHHNPRVILASSVGLLLLIQHAFPGRWPQIMLQLRQRLLDFSQKHSRIPSVLFWGFILGVMLVSYRFFWNHALSEAGVFLLLFLALTIHLTRPLPSPSLNRFERILFRVAILGLSLLPLIPIGHHFGFWEQLSPDDEAALSSLDLETLPLLDESLTLSSEVASTAYAQLDGSLLFTHAPLLIQIDPTAIPTFSSKARFQLIFQGSGLLSGNAFFTLSNLKEYSAVGPWEAFTLYRKKTGDVIEIPAQTEDLYSLISTLPQDSTVALLSPHQTLSSTEVLSKDLPLTDTASLHEYTPHLAIQDLLFYTVLQDHLDLELTLQTSEYEDRSLRLSVFDGEGAVVYDERIEGEELLSTVAISLKDLMPGLYQVSLTTETENSSEDPFQLTGISLNSSRLVLWSDHWESHGPHSLHFNYPYPQAFNCVSSQFETSFIALGGSLTSPAGVNFSDLNDIPLLKDDLYAFSTPLATYECSSEDPLLYSFTRDSWFNPFEAWVTESNPLAADYLLIENDHPASALTEVWNVLEWETSTRTLQEDPFVLDFEGWPASWLLIRSLDVEFL